MKQPLRFARHLRLIVVAYLMFTSDFTVVAQQTPSALTGRKTISGIVLDIETDQPIVGAQVWLKDTTIGSTTNSSGRFEISFQGNYTVLNVSFLGYETREIVFTPGNEITIKLSSSSTTVDEVVVVGYGVQKKASVVGAISTISVNDIKAPVAKISNNLAGQLAGVVSVQRSGEPGVGSTFWIRGINTFGSAKTPLILVDGIERDMDLVNVDDIKEMSILKDASATAIYGVRGANGVVMITTRDGVVGKPKVSLSFEAGMLSPTKIPEMLNSVQFAKMYNEAYGSKYFSDEAVERYRTESSVRRFFASAGGARFRRRAASLSTTCGSRAPGESNAQPEEAKQAEQKRPREQAPAIGKAPSKGGETAPQQTAGRQSGEHPASSAGTLC